VLVCPTARRQALEMVAFRRRILAGARRASGDTARHVAGSDLRSGARAGPATLARPDRVAEVVCLDYVVNSDAGKQRCVDRDTRCHVQRNVA